MNSEAWKRWEQERSDLEDKSAGPVCLFGIGRHCSLINSVTAIATKKGWRENTLTASLNLERFHVRRMISFLALVNFYDARDIHILS